jgi:hypothetical protein
VWWTSWPRKGSSRTLTRCPPTTGHTGCMSGLYGAEERRASDLYRETDMGGREGQYLGPYCSKPAVRAAGKGRDRENHVPTWSRDSRAAWPSAHVTLTVTAAVMLCARDQVTHFVTIAKFDGSKRAVSPPFPLSYRSPLLTHYCSMV